MHYFHNSKVIATMGPAIDKETVLSKIINNIDTFRINLSHGDEDTKKKYIDMVLKLDSSKSIMLDTRGPEVRTRNKEELFLDDDQNIKIEYAEFFKDSHETLYIDYNNIDHIGVGTVLEIDSNTIQLEITANKEDHLEAKVIKGGMILINRQVDFEGYIPELPFLGEKDKKHIIWGIDHKINLISVSYIKTAQDIKQVKEFLKSVHGEHLKIVTKIETQSAIENIKEIIQISDGVILSEKKLCILTGNNEKVEELKSHIIKLCQILGKPVILNIDIESVTEDESHKLVQDDYVKVTSEIQNGIDTFMLTRASAISERPIENILSLYDTINNSGVKPITSYTIGNIPIEHDRMISDYIIYSAYRASKDLPIKAILCPTESGYTPARLSSLKPEVPIISFTKNDNAFRYINLLRGVKGYKIATTFEYKNIKQIGKEIIRILFKGNISLDDKILIVHSSLEQNISGMINGIELFKFKDI